MARTPRRRCGRNTSGRSSRRSTTRREGYGRRAGLPQSHAHGRARESVRPVDGRLQSAPLRSPVRGPDKVRQAVVQGGLTTGLLHALVAMDLPGPGTVFLSQNWKFTAPVYIGDTITAEAEIVSVHESKPVCQLKVRVARQTGETVLEGEAWCYTFEAGS